MTSRAEHQRVLELAPWWVNGTADAAERVRVEDHLVSCADCRREVALLRQLGELEAARPPAVAPHPARFRTLMRRIETQSVNGDAVEDSARGRRSRPGQVPGMWFLVGAQSVMILVLIGFVFVDRLPSASGDAPAVYRTLTRDARNGDPVSVRVVFVSAVTEQEILALLSDLGASIIGGPSALGVYTLELATTPRRGAVAPERAVGGLAGDDDAARTVELLREDPRVRFVSRVGPP